MTTRAVLGLDVGSTYVKVLATTPDGAELSGARRPSPWVSLPLGHTEMDAGRLVTTVTDLLAEVVAELESAYGEVQVVGIGVSGMAESGVLVGATGTVAHPVIAWFDPRGEDEITRTPDDFQAEFCGRTGLPLSALATIAKLLHLRAQGLDLTPYRWLSVAEYVVHALGGDAAAELSLASRTGMLDQDDARPWPRALEVLGVGPEFLPPLRTAGQSWGEVTATSALPASVVGASLTVAGHDHLVASIAAGTLESHQLYCSMGTAEALVRVLDHPLDRAARDRLARHGINVLRHALPGKSIMLVGTRTGLLLRRVLQLIGVEDAAGRAALDERVMRLPVDVVDTIDTLSVTGAKNDDGVLQIRADGDGLSPELLFAATLRHGTETITWHLDLMTAEVAPHTQTLVSGGWASMRSVRRERASLWPDLTCSTRSEDTAFGAAMFGAYAAATQRAERPDLVAFAADFCTAPGRLPLGHPDPAAPTTSNRGTPWSTQSPSS